MYVTRTRATHSSYLSRLLAQMDGSVSLGRGDLLLVIIKRPLVSVVQEPKHISQVILDRVGHCASEERRDECLGPESGHAGEYKWRACTRDALGDANGTGSERYSTSYQTFNFEWLSAYFALRFLIGQAPELVFLPMAQNVIQHSAMLEQSQMEQ